MVTTLLRRFFRPTLIADDSSLEREGFRFMQTPFFSELFQVLKRTEIWLYMAWIDIVLRYKRTKLGPFWMVIVSFISIVCIASLGSLLFRVKFGDFFPYVACGMVIWNFIAAMLTDSCLVFIAQIGMIKHLNVYLLSFGLRMFVRNAIIFLHNLVIVLLVLLYYQVHMGYSILLLGVGLVIFSVTALSISVIIGFLCTRFRDVLQLIQALISILAFLTPIMWQPNMLGSKAYLVNFNPLTHYIAILREPLLGRFPSDLNLMVVTCLSLFFFICASAVFNKYRKQLVHWL